MRAAFGPFTLVFYLLFLDNVLRHLLAFRIGLYLRHMVAQNSSGYPPPLSTNPAISRLLISSLIFTGIEMIMSEEMIYQITVH
jgi:hypothetical protein